MNAGDGLNNKFMLFCRDNSPDDSPLNSRDDSPDDSPLNSPDDSPLNSPGDSRNQTATLADHESSLTLISPSPES